MQTELVRVVHKRRQDVAAVLFRAHKPRHPVRGRQIPQDAADGVLPVGPERVQQRDDASLERVELPGEVADDLHSPARGFLQRNTVLKERVQDRNAPSRSGLIRHVPQDALVAFQHGGDCSLRGDAVNLAGFGRQHLGQLTRVERLKDVVLLRHLPDALSGFPADADVRVAAHDRRDLGREARPRDPGASDGARLHVLSGHSREDHVRQAQNLSRPRCHQHLRKGRTDACTNSFPRVAGGDHIGEIPVPVHQPLGRPRRERAKHDHLLPVAQRQQARPVTRRTRGPQYPTHLQGKSFAHLARDVDRAVQGFRRLVEEADHLVHSFRSRNAGGFRLCCALRAERRNQRGRSLGRKFGADDVAHLSDRSAVLLRDQDVREDALALYRACPPAHLRAGVEQRACVLVGGASLVLRAREARDLHVRHGLRPCAIDGDGVREDGVSVGKLAHVLGEQFARLGDERITKRHDVALVRPVRPVVHHLAERVHRRRVRKVHKALRVPHVREDQRVQEGATGDGAALDRLRQRSDVRLCDGESGDVGLRALLDVQSGLGQLCAELVRQAHERAAGVLHDRSQRLLLQRLRRSGEVPHAFKGSAGLVEDRALVDRVDDVLEVFELVHERRAARPLGQHLRARRLAPLGLRVQAHAAGDVCGLNLGRIERLAQRLKLRRHKRGARRLGLCVSQALLLVPQCLRRALSLGLPLEAGLRTRYDGLAGFSRDLRDLLLGEPVPQVVRIEVEVVRRRTLGRREGLKAVVVRIPQRARPDEGVLVLVDLLPLRIAVRTRAFPAALHVQHRVGRHLDGRLRRHIERRAPPLHGLDDHDRLAAHAGLEPHDTTNETVCRHRARATLVPNPCGLRQVAHLPRDVGVRDEDLISQSDQRHVGGLGVRI